MTDHTLTARTRPFCYPTCRMVAFPLFLVRSSFSSFLFSSSRDADDPQVSLQLQRQLHRPPHLGVHALAPEDGAGTPEPPAGQPGSHRNQHG